MEGERKRGEKQGVFKNKHFTFVSQFQKLRMKSTNSHRWDTEGAKKKKKKKEVLRKPELNLKSEAIKWVTDFRNKCQPEVPRGHKII